jgi:hypothetical protein
LLAVFPLVRPLPSPTSAATALFGGFAGTTGRSDFPCPFIPGLPPRRCLDGPPGDQPDGRTRDLPVLAHEGSAHALVPKTARGPPATRDNAASGVAFHLLDTVDTPKPGFRGSITRPARAPTNASPRPHGTSTHGSGTPWVATPSTQSSSISSSMPVYPGAFPRSSRGYFRSIHVLVAAISLAHRGSP